MSLLLDIVQCRCRDQDSTQLVVHAICLLHNWYSNIKSVKMIEEIIAALAAHWQVVLSIGIIAYCLKNYFNNGLNTYPGPALAKVTDCWRFWDVYRRRPDITQLALHRKHGDIVRLGPNCLSFANPQAIKQIYGLNKGMTKVRAPTTLLPATILRPLKSGFYPVQQAVSNGNRLPSLFSTTDETYHAQLRRCVNSAFSMSTLVQYEPMVNEVLDLFLSQTARIYAQPNQPCDFAKWLQFFAFDVIGQITYSKSHGFVETNSDVDGMIAYLARLFSYVAPVGQMPWLDLLFLKNPLLLLLDKWGVKLTAFPITTFAKNRMAERLSAPPSPTATPSDSKPAAASQHVDLLSKFLAAQTTNPDTMTDARVLTMAVSMAFAGSETTAISLSAVFYHLLRNPKCYARLQTELNDAVTSNQIQNRPNGLITWAESQTLPYLDACIKEAFRIHPAAGLPLERVVPKEGMEIDGHFVRGGTIVGCNAWVLHKRSEVFDPLNKYDVDRYEPDRWLDPTVDKGTFSFPPVSS